MKYLGIEGLKYLCNKISTALKNAEGKTGSTASSKKLFLVGSQTQAESSKTYSSSDLYYDNYALNVPEVVVHNTMTPGSSTVTIGSSEQMFDSVYAYVLEGNISNASVTFDSDDGYTNPTSWINISTLGSANVSTLFNQLSGMMANMRYLKNKVDNASSMIFKPVLYIANSSTTYFGDNVKLPTGGELQLIAEFDTEFVKTINSGYVPNYGHYLLRKAGYYRITIFNRSLNYIWSSHIRAIDFFGGSYNDFVIQGDMVNNMHQHVIYADADSVANQNTDISIIINIAPETINQYDNCGMNDWHIGFEYLGN